MQLPLVLTAALIVALFLRDVLRRSGVSAASWLVLAWAVIFASRPVSAWFDSGTSMSSVEDYLDGSPIDRAVYLTLITLGYVVLFRRRTAVKQLLRRNRTLLVFYGFWLASVLWSDFPFVAFKRLFKDFGAVVMVGVLLTEREPVEAIKAVFVRAAYLLVPMSFLFVRFIPEIGRAYTGYNRDELMYVGVATHKNTLGALLLVSSIFLVWDFATRRRDALRRAALTGISLDGLLVLAMCAYLLRIANSATAMLCTVIGVTLFLGTGLPAVRRRMRYVELYVIAGAALWFSLDYVFHLNELIVASVGRDMTLTTRTDAWQLFMVLDINPFFGAGFKSFWAGERMATIWRDFPGIVQAHNGYIETYLEGGIAGLICLGALLVSGLRSIKRQILTGDSYARVRWTFLVITLFYNFSEAAFTQLSLLWIVTLLVVTDEGPKGVPHVAVAAARRPLDPAAHFRIDRPASPRIGRARVPKRVM